MLREKLETLRILEAMQDGRFTLMREAGGSGQLPTLRRRDATSSSR